MNDYLGHADFSQILTDETRLLRHTLFTKKPFLWKQEVF